MINIKNEVDRKVSSVSVWALAFSPIIGVILQTYISDFLSMNFSTLWVVSISVMVAAAIFDVECLKKEGKYNARIGSPMFFPLYIYRRATALNHLMGYVLVLYLLIALVIFTPTWKIVTIIL